MNPKQYYKNLSEHTSLDLVKIKKSIKNNAFSRLATFLIICGSVFGLIQFSLWGGIILAFGTTIVFGVLIKRHLKLLKRKDYLDAKLTIVQNELQALNYNFKVFKDGKEFKDIHHSYSNDLDLFGEASFFQQINRTTTQQGEKILASSLAVETTDYNEIIEEQDAIKELSKNPDFLIHFRSIGTTSDTVEEDHRIIEDWKNHISYISKYKIIRYLSYILPGITFLALLSLILYGIGTSALIVLFLSNLIIVGFFVKKTNEEQARVSSFLKVIKKYNDLVKTIKDKSFKSNKLKQLYTELFNDQSDASEALHLLTKKVNALDARLNLVAAIFLQGIFQWDFHCLYRIEKWRTTYGEQLLGWLEAIAQLDCRVTKGNFYYNYPDFNFPEKATDSFLTGQDLGHPFLKPEVRVGNDFKVSNEGDFTIITGANMAGKSTFLRTIGINLVMAMAGLPVPAKKLKFTPGEIFTSMRTADSLSENESYFYAELKRLKELIQTLESGAKPFIILDEILKGTNSLDKQRGSKLALEKILELGGTGIIATHDLALTEIENKFPENITNKCFEIEIDNAKINFDYKLYDGVTKNMNAMLLMEQMGIV